MKTDTKTSRGLRIFVVDDHEDTLEYLVLILKTRGHTVFSAATYQEALEDLPASNCEVLISDIGLPDGSGWDLLRDVQLEKPIYGIAISGYGMTSDRMKSREAGFQQHLVKPVDMTKIEDILADISISGRD